MKKIIVMIMVLVLGGAFVGCGGTSKQDVNLQEPVENIEVETTEVENAIVEETEAELYANATELGHRYGMDVVTDVKLVMNSEGLSSILTFGVIDGKDAVLTVNSDGTCELKSGDDLKLH
jgi:outer membrane lipopolysaccharide assembly protein LptE/RlpB